MFPTRPNSRWPCLAPAFLAALLLAASPSVAASLIAGDDRGPQVRFDFADGEHGPEARIRTMRVGVAGSRLRVLVDRSTTPLLERLFGGDECRFADSGSVCEIRLAAEDPAYAALVEGFKAGLVGHVTIDDAGSMRMQEDVSLHGFRRAYGR